MDSRGFPQVFNLKQLHWNNIKWICTFSFNFNINHFHTQAQNFREQIQQIKTIINQVCSFNTFSSLKPWGWQKNWISVLLLFSGFLLIKKRKEKTVYIWDTFCLLVGLGAFFCPCITLASQNFNEDIVCFFSSFYIPFSPRHTSGWSLIQIMVVKHCSKCFWVFVANLFFPFWSRDLFCTLWWALCFCPFEVFSFVASLGL